MDKLPQARIAISVQTEDFDLGHEADALSAGDRGIGAMVSFVGLVRDLNLAEDVVALELEHYPGMTEKALQAIEVQARERWPLLHVHILHRVGDLAPGEPIVFVGVSSAHRQAAFSACDFIMDYLKTRAPLWKKEQGADGAYWVDGRDSDQQAAARW